MARRVAVYAKMTAVSTSPVRPGKTYPLSPLDHAMGAHAVRLVFYYRAGPELDRDRLKESLSEVLSHYPAVTGRMSRAADDGNWVVRCNDAGVRVLDARASVTLDEWLGSAGPDEELELAWWEPMGDDVSTWSPFNIQITEFADKGYAIGLSCNHMHADPSSAALLLKAWSDTHRAAFIASPPFFHPPGLRSRPTQSLAAISTASASASLLSAKTSAAAAPSAALKMSTATFTFPDPALRSLLTAAGPAAAPSDALAALFWSRISRAADRPLGSLTLCVEFRKRLQAPLPQGFYGNALHFSRASADPEAGLADLAAAVRGLVEGTPEEEYWSAIEWVESRRSAEGRYAEAFQMYGPELTCALLDHVPTYEAAFGERPAHTTCRIDGAVGEGLVLVWPGPDESGVGRTVIVTLPKDQTAKICRDEEILRHGPTLLFYGRIE